MSAIGSFSRGNASRALRLVGLLLCLFHFDCIGACTGVHRARLLIDPSRISRRSLGVDAEYAAIQCSQKRDFHKALIQVQSELEGIVVGHFDVCDTSEPDVVVLTVITTRIQ